MGGRTLPHLTFVRLTAEGFGVAWWHGLQVRAALGVAGRTHFLVGLAGVGGAEYLFCWPMAAVCLCLTWTLPCALPIGGRVVSTGGGALGPPGPHSSPPHSLGICGTREAGPWRGCQHHLAQ